MKKLVLLSILLLSGCGSSNIFYDKHLQLLSEYEGYAISTPSTTSTPISVEEVQDILYSLYSTYVYKADEGEDTWTISLLSYGALWSGDCEDSTYSTANYLLDIRAISSDNISIGFVHLKDDTTNTKANHATGIYTIKGIRYIVDYSNIYTIKEYSEKYTTSGILFEFNLGEVR